MIYNLKKYSLKIIIKINIKIKIRKLDNHIPILKGIFLIIYPFLIKKSEKEKQYFHQCPANFVNNS